MKTYKNDYFNHFMEADRASFSLPIAKNRELIIEPETLQIGDRNILSGVSDWYFRVLK